MEVEKMNLLKKVTAALSAVVMAAGAVSAIPTCAIGISPDKNGKQSAFEYELETYRLSDTRIGVRIATINNPGVLKFGLVLKYDADCTLMDLEQNLPDFLVSIQNDTNKHQIIVPMLSVNSDRDGTCIDNLNDFSCYFEFSVPSSSAYPLQFSSCVYKYDSLNEGISFDFDSTKDSRPRDTSVGVKLKDVPYRIGDVDEDNKITMDDGFSILQMAKYGNNLLTVDDLNEYLFKHSIYKGTRTWNDMFPKLTYAECADANQDGYIKEEDSDEIMEYYSQAAASNITMSTLVNTIGYKTVTYEY